MFIHVFIVVVFFVLRYGNTWQYLDETIAHIVRLEGRYHSAGCAAVNGKSISGFLTCVDKTAARFLCELVGKVRAIPETVQMPDPPATSSYRIKVTSCPGGHLTHEFLACDVQSSCQARDAAASSSCVTRGDETVAVCPTALTPLPPSFQCSNGRGEVPYTLVCDHRPDCSDDSDEKFCVYPMCDAVTEFTCENKQVRGICPS